MTDWKDFYSLTTGVSALPQDKPQRIYILAHREARLSGQVIFQNEDGHPLEARRLPPRNEISEDDLEEPDDHWIEINFENLQKIQRFASSSRSTSRSSARSTSDDMCYEYDERNS